MEAISLIESARSLLYVAQRQGDKWKKRKDGAIVNIYAKFYSIPASDSEKFQTFCWSELLLYKHFRNIEQDIGLTKDVIIANWYQLSSYGFTVWHVPQTTASISEADNQEDDNDETTSLKNIEMQEWELLSRMGHINYDDLDDMKILGRREFDMNQNWQEHTVPQNLHDCAPDFIALNKICITTNVTNQDSAPIYKLSLD